MKIKNNRFLITLFLLIFNSIIILLFYLLKIPSMIILNPIVVIFGLAELILLNIFSAILFNQFIKYKKRIFGEILKFKITSYLIVNIISILILVILVFSLIEYSPSITKVYDNFNFLIEENYLNTIDNINEYRNNLNKLIDDDYNKAIKILMEDPLIQFLQFRDQTFISNVDKDFVNEILLTEIDKITFTEKNNKGYFVFNHNNFSFIYQVPQEIINSKNNLFELITQYKKIYSQKKNAPLIILLSIFFIIIPFLLFQVFYLFKYISNLTKPLELLVDQFKKVSSNIYAPIPLTKKRFDELSFLIIQFNRMQKQLEQRTLLLKYQERFEILAKVTSRFAHEIKNPLTPIVLSCELIEKKYPYQDNYRLYLTSKLKVIQENVESIRNSINKFYSINEKNNENRLYISINEFLKNIENFWNSDWIELKVEIPTEPIYLFAQKDELESLFNNLIINSYEASKIEVDQKCGIFIASKIEDEKYFKIIYTDSGSGIKEIDPNKIFEPYYTTKENGSGFGLAIVRSIVESMNGNIEFIGNGKLDILNYKGATFLIRLPYFKQIY